MSSPISEIPSFRLSVKIKGVHAVSPSKMASSWQTEGPPGDFFMYDPSKILAWIVANVEGMRLSRAKTLAAIVSGALAMRGIGVLALGRAMSGEVAAKHRIKRVWRFLRNDGVETESVCAGLFHFLRPPTGRTIILVDWTDLEPFQQLVFSLPRDGRALPFLWITIRKKAKEEDNKGVMVAAEKRALDMLARMCPAELRPVLIADRGFGHPRWLSDIRSKGWHFVQRLSQIHQVNVQNHIGSLKELGMRRGWRARDWGWGTMDEQEFGPIRLVSIFEKESEEAWYLVTSLDVECPAEIVRLYKRRMWTEAMFRDLKNRDWGLGLDHVRLSGPEKHDRHFCIVALAYILLSAFGALAEKYEIAKTLKANTRRERVMNLARIGNHLLQNYRCSLKNAFTALLLLPI